MAESLALKDPHQEKRLYRQRLIWLSSLLLTLVLVLLIRYFTLQVVYYQKFSTQSDANRILTQIIPPQRGLILDRNGVLLASNQPSFSLNITRERTPDLEATLTTLQQLVKITPEQIERFHRNFNKRGHRPYQSVPLLYPLDDKQIARIAVNEWRLPGVEVAARLVRHYPLGTLTAHNIGYVGSISDSDIDALTATGKWSEYEGVIFSIGKSGIEKVYEDDLLGISGLRNVEVNARGQVLREIDKVPPQSGKNLTLFLDSRLQQLAMDRLGSQRGAVVALDTRTGGVVVAASSPSFDPNLFVTGISNRDYDALQNDWQLPLFNRLLQGQYPPGSTLKPFMGLAGLEAELITPSTTISDPGYFQLPNDTRLYRDWKKQGHGSRVNLRQAIAESCDTYFYQLGFQLGVERISSLFHEFGLGERTGVDLTYERSGVLPTPAWKRQRTRLPWFPGDTVNLSIGQGDMLVTPMQLAYATAVLANHGRRLTPHMVAKIDDTAVAPIETLPPLQLKDTSRWDDIINGMVDVVHNPRGTASHLSRGLTYRMAGKTGTAQVVGIKQDEKYDRERTALRNRDHALFIAFAPVEQPRLAVAVIIENGEHGSSAAGPIARAIFDAYLSEPESQETVDAP